MEGEIAILNSYIWNSTIKDGETVSDVDFLSIYFVTYHVSTLNLEKIQESYLLLDSLQASFTYLACLELHTLIRLSSRRARSRFPLLFSSSRCFIKDLDSPYSYSSFTDLKARHLGLGENWYKPSLGGHKSMVSMDDEKSPRVESDLEKSMSSNTYDFHQQRSCFVPGSHPLSDSTQNPSFRLAQTPQESLSIDSTPHFCHTKQSNKEQMSAPLPARRSK